MGIIIRILINAAALWVAVTVLGGFEFDFESGSVIAFLGVALLMGVVNVIVRPILTAISFPAIVLTLGLFLLVVNAVTLAIVVWLSDALGLGLESDGFGWTFVAAIVISVVSWILETFLGRS